MKNANVNDFMLQAFALYHDVQHTAAFKVSIHANNKERPPLSIVGINYYMFASKISDKIVIQCSYVMLVLHAASC